MSKILDLIKNYIILKEGEAFLIKYKNTENNNFLYGIRYLHCNKGYGFYKHNSYGECRENSMSEDIIIDAIKLDCMNIPWKMILYADGYKECWADLDVHKKYLILHQSVQNGFHFGVENPIRMGKELCFFKSNDVIYYCDPEELFMRKD